MSDKQDNVEIDGAEEEVPREKAEGMLAILQEQGWKDVYDTFIGPALESAHEGLDAGEFGDMPIELIRHNSGMCSLASRIRDLPETIAIALNVQQ